MTRLTQKEIASLRPRAWEMYYEDTVEDRQPLDMWCHLPDWMKTIYLIQAYEELKGIKK